MRIMQVVTAEQLYKDRVITDSERNFFGSRTVLKFGSLKAVTKFVCDLYEHLVRDHGSEYARRFPLFGVHKPYEVVLAESADPVLSRDLIGIRLWAVPNDRFEEVRPYIDRM